MQFEGALSEKAWFLYDYGVYVSINTQTVQAYLESIPKKKKTGA